MSVLQLDADAGDLVQPALPPGLEAAMKEGVSLAVALAAGLVLGSTAAGTARQQEVYTRPTFGATPVNVEGAVVVKHGSISIDNSPVVNAQQVGSWQVALTGRPQVALGPPASVTAGERFSVTWTDGRSDVLRVNRVADDGWVEAVAAGSTEASWYNFSQARAVRRMP
jgi:hypothetical protein